MHFQAVVELGDGAAGAEVRWRILDGAGDPVGTTEWLASGITETGKVPGEYLIVGEADLTAGRLAVGLLRGEEVIPCVDEWLQEDLSSIATRLDQTATLASVAAQLAAAAAL